MNKTALACKTLAATAFVTAFFVGSRFANTDDTATKRLARCKRKHPWKRVVTTAALMLWLGGPLPAQAAAIGGFLNEEAKADVYALTCPEETRSVRARVNEGNTTGVQFSVVVINPLGRAASASAVDNGLSEFTGRAGNYLAVVHTDEDGGEGYSVAFNCHDAAGAALDIQAVRVQNQ